MRYVLETGEVKDEIFDMVVLSVGMVIPPDVVALAKQLDVPLSPNNFVETSCFAPTTTFRTVFTPAAPLTAPRTSPKRSWKAAPPQLGIQVLAAAQGTFTQEKVFPPEKDVAKEAPRIGVFVCHCGLNIGGIADVPAMVEYAKDIPNVVYVQANLFSCSQDAQTQMAEVIKEHNLNRVVMAACSPSTHQPIFQDMLRTAGLNKYLFEMANIRNQCTWVHQASPRRPRRNART